MFPGLAPYTLSSSSPLLAMLRRALLCCNLSTASLSTHQNSKCCSWDGVDCDDETGHVIGLDLSSSCVYGSINSNSSLFRLVHLRRLNLVEATNFSRNIPSSIRKLKSLSHLNLAGCNFSGQISSSLANLTQLTYLSLGRPNNFVGGRPLSWLGKLTQLTYLDLGGTHLNGSIPSSLGNLSQLTDLYLYDNQLSGLIPSSLGNLSRLTSLDRYANRLNGSIPESLFNLNLTFLGLGVNNLRGKLDICKLSRALSVRLFLD